MSQRDFVSVPLDKFIVVDIFTFVVFLFHDYECLRGYVCTMCIQ